MFESQSYAYNHSFVSIISFYAFVPSVTNFSKFTLQEKNKLHGYIINCTWKTKKCLQIITKLKVNTVGHLLYHQVR